MRLLQRITHWATALAFIGLAVHNLGEYGLVLLFWFALALVTFVPVQTLVWVVAGSWDPLQSGRVLTTWVAAALWPVWEFGMVLVGTMLVTQVCRRGRVAQLLAFGCAAVVLTMPAISDLNEWSAGATDSPTRAMFIITCGIVAALLGQHAMQAMNPPESER